MKKLVRKQGGEVEVTHYVDGLFEHHRWRGPHGEGQNNQLHVHDGTQRVALVRLGAAHPDDRGPAVQFTLGDHLGSSNVVTDAAGGAGQSRGVHAVRRDQLRQLRQEALSLHRL